MRDVILIGSDDYDLDRVVLKTLGLNRNGTGNLEWRRGIARLIFLIGCLFISVYYDGQRATGAAGRGKI